MNDIVAKDLLRDMFHAGTLDLSADAETLERFVRIFSGEMEAMLAVDHNAALFLDHLPIERWVDLAAPTEEAARYYNGWHDRAS